jgi:hypothetical protein
MVDGAAADRVRPVPKSAEEDQADIEAVTELLGRSPKGRFEVMLRTDAGTPMVIANLPLLEDGTPMPTRYWLVDKKLNRRIGQLESTGGVRQAEEAVDALELATAHAVYAAQRDSLIPASWTGPRPFGGVGGTRRGVKCLHTHYAWFLVGGDDPVGRWVHNQLESKQPDSARHAVSSREEVPCPQQPGESE